MTLIKHHAVGQRVGPSFARRIISCLLLVALLCCIGSAQVVPRGGTADVPLPSHLIPANGQSWDILNPSGTIIATSSVPNGWNVGALIYSGGIFETPVTAPSTAAGGSPYTVRRKSGPTLSYSGTFAVAQQDPPLALRYEKPTLGLSFLDRLFQDRRSILS